MKTLSKVLVAIATLFASSILVCCDAIVESEKLPEAAQNFIKEYFPQTAVSFVKKDVEFLKTTYEVTLQDGTEIDFNSKGEWDKVDGKRLAVPGTLVPSAITEYVQTNFPGQIIVKIDNELYGYEIELGCDMELKFDKNGKLWTVDD